jgi:hypothetical protein
LANGGACAGLVHSHLGTQREAISCCRLALDLAGERKNPMARGVLVIMLAEFGDACRAVGDLPAAVAVWRLAVQVLDDLGWPDLLASWCQARAGRPAGIANTAAASSLARTSPHPPTPDGHPAAG